MSDIENQTNNNKKRQSKYTEEEKKERHKQALIKYRNNPDIKNKLNDYCKERYHNLEPEAKKMFNHKLITKYYNMTDEEYKNYLIQCRPYKRKYHQKKIEEKKLLEEEQQIIINKERERTINNRTINAMKDPRYNDYIICV
jgi:hypothetical protein